MPSSSAAMRCLALAALVMGAAPAFAQGANDPGTIVVQPARVPVAGSPGSYDSSANLPSPPAGPIESRLLPIPEGTNVRVPQTAAAAPPPATTFGSLFAPSAPPSEPAAGPLSVIPFTGQSANLTDATKAELERVAKAISDKRIRHIELRAFAAGGDLDSRKIALARALVVRSYLIDLRVRARIEVGSFAGDGQQVEIVVPNT